MGKLSYSVMVSFVSKCVLPRCDQQYAHFELNRNVFNIISMVQDQCSNNVITRSNKHNEVTHCSTLLNSLVQTEKVVELKHYISSIASLIMIIDHYICIGVNRPAFGGIVPHFHQMSREMRQMSRIFILLLFFFFIIFFFVADYFTFLPCNATK